MTETIERLDLNTPIAVTLRVGDWMEIRDNLYLDANAENEGKETTALYDAGSGNEIMLARAAEKDSQAYCHDNCYATERAAQTIDRVLKSHGFTELGARVAIGIRYEYHNFDGRRWQQDTVYASQEAAEAAALLCSEMNGHHNVRVVTDAERRRPIDLPNGDNTLTAYTCAAVCGCNMELRSHN